ncbi:MAG TPA: glycoside hydrolase family 2 TIM barrel-domain containing protein [Candidatus Saccharimonadales bacterium]|nr:glycoside hydrolase family 2 TIM barrel-domain containing protein [Candidatus Saccharimonadales bacterium]
MRAFLIVAVAIYFVFGLTTNGQPRENQSLNSDWRFALGDIRGAANNGFDDSGWQPVSLPHNWGWEEAQQGKSFYRGAGWYRRQLNVSPQPGKRFFLRFEAASLVADVYLNEKLLGQHRGGFGAFCFEITTQLSQTGTNLLAVRVDNTKAPDIAPLEGDFSVYGGLYRPVHLIVTGQENFCLTDHGSPGVAWSQTSVAPTQAALDVTAQISNGSRAKTPLQLVATVLDADGKPVVRGGQSITLAPRDTAPYLLRLTVPRPHLWNGRKDPYLYKARVELLSSNEVVDSVEQPLGLRFYSVDPDNGFLLNGQPYHLHGVDRHQDYMDKGWAISESDMDQDISLIKELGATAVRCAHYQHSDYFYSLCDAAGILVWAEIPQVNVIRDTPEFENTSRNQLLDLIRQNINHPSIFVWSLGNEIGSGSDDPHRELQDLTAVAAGEDPTRPTIEATMTAARPQMNKIPDLLGWNIYPGWYRGAKEDYGRQLDALRDTSRHGAFCVSEYGAGANPAQHEQNPVQPKPGGQWHPEEWQAELHETAWAAMKQRPFVWATFVWCMFDFAVSSRHEGGIKGLNDKGLVTRDRKIKKDAFYFYKVNWSDQPVLYIASRRFTGRTNAVTDVKLYSNTKEPELLINGVSQGGRNDGDNGVFIWKNLTLSPGENKISARAQANGQTLTDECVWNLQSAR